MIASIMKLGKGKVISSISNQIKAALLIILFSSFTLFVSAQNKVIKIACVGNSITYGAGIKNQLRDAYPFVLGRMLGDGY